jgi:hypothetical protein
MHVFAGFAAVCILGDTDCNGDPSTGFDDLPALGNSMDGGETVLAILNFNDDPFAPVTTVAAKSRTIGVGISEDGSVTSPVAGKFFRTWNTLSSIHAAHINASTGIPVGCSIQVYNVGNLGPDSSHPDLEFTVTGFSRLPALVGAAWDNTVGCVSMAGTDAYNRTAYMSASV